MSSTRDVKQATITDTLSWYKIFPLSGYNPVTQTESHLHRQLIGIWKIMWRSSMESPNFNTSSILDKWHRWESGSASKRRYFSSIATARIGWKVMVWFYGMLLLSAKCPRLPGRWENPVWKTFGRTAQFSVRDFEFREPTPRWEPTVRSEDFSRELQGEPGVSTDRIDRWRWSPCRLLVGP